MPNGKSAILDRSADKITRTREKETGGFCASDDFVGEVVFSK